MDVLSDRLAEILLLLIPGERYGLQIAEGWERDHGQRFPLGSLYANMGTLEREGLVVSRLGEADQERGGNRRKYFKITDTGRAALHEHEERARNRARLFGAILGTA